MKQQTSLFMLALTFASVLGQQAFPCWVGPVLCHPGLPIVTSSGGQRNTRCCPAGFSLTTVAGKCSCSAPLHLPSSLTATSGANTGGSSGDRSNISTFFKDTFNLTRFQQDLRAFQDSIRRMVEAARPDSGEPLPHFVNSGNQGA